MSLAKNLLVFLLIFILVFNLIFYFYSKQTKIFTTSELLEQPRNVTSYEGQGQFFPNMLFNHRNITFRINENCNLKKKENLAFAFAKLEIELNKLLVFEKTNSNEDIFITCSLTEEKEKKSQFYIAGEGGPERAVSSGKFWIIEKGEVLLYNTPEKACLGYNVELHELLHVLGFNHSTNRQSLMYPFSECGQILTDDIVDELKRLYNIPQYPDISLHNVSAIKHGIYLDFSAEVRNQGITKAYSTKLAVFSKNKEIKTFELGDINYGEGKFLSVENIMIPLSSLSLEELKFSVTTSENELDYENNNVTLNVD